MSKAREQIFAAIRRNKAARMPASGTGQLIDATQANTLPAKACLSGQPLMDLFEQQLLASAATLTTVTTLSQVPEAVGDFIGSLEQADNRCFANGDMAQLHWSTAPALSVSAAPQDYDRAICISRGYRGIAETGSVVLLSQAGLSSASYFLPECLIVVLPRAGIIASQEALWANLRQRSSTLPRTVNLVTGPSRTGDIEQKIVLGAHGPKQLHVIVVDN